MDTTKFWCITWNPFSRDLSTERLDKYIEANQEDFMDATDQDRTEVILEIFDTEDPILINERIKHWSSLQIDPPPISGCNPEQ